MGLMVHSLENVPMTENRNYFIYLLDYGWDEPISQTLRKNFDNMANISAKNKAVIIKGTEIAHFENEVFSWHHINNEDASELLPALLITNKHPSYFRENLKTFSGRQNILRVNDEYNNMKMVLIPFRKFCKTSTDAITLIEKVFADIIAENDLSNFKITRELKKVL
jgi:hypothetical protein